MCMHIAVRNRFFVSDNDMYNVKFIRDNAGKFDEGMKKRGMNVFSDTILELDKKIRDTKNSLQELQGQKNILARSVAEKKKNGLDIGDMIQQGEELRSQISVLEKKVEEREGELHNILIALPNIPDEGVPHGVDENDNIEISQWGEPRDFGFIPKPHWELGVQLKQLDFERAVQMSGSRFYIATEMLARLARAIADFCLDINIQKRGYVEVRTPILVKDDAMFGAGQLPKFAEDSFSVDGGEYRMIPTSEVVLVNLAANSILVEDQLPMRLVAYTPCFRSEAGSAGKDTRGMMRMHQFYKVELVHLCTPDQIEKEYNYMIESVESLLKSLELPCRKVLLCSQDMGFSARKTYDFEAWMPNQSKYREVSSCSDCGDFQALRMKARFRCSKTGTNQHLYTTNGSGLAIERILIAIMENYQREDGAIEIPRVLRSYMGGVSEISASSLKHPFLS
jgi:seryl-tRNA synthetase